MTSKEIIECLTSAELRIKFAREAAERGDLDMANMETVAVADRVRRALSYFDDEGF